MHAFTAEPTESLTVNPPICSTMQLCKLSARWCDFVVVVVANNIQISWRAKTGVGLSMYIMPVLKDTLLLILLLLKYYLFMSALKAEIQH